MKIPFNYLSSDEKLYFQHSDKFFTYSLIELAGRDRIMFLDDFLVFKDYQKADKKCENSMIQYE